MTAVKNPSVRMKAAVISLILAASLLPGAPAFATYPGDDGMVAYWTSDTNSGYALKMIDPADISTKRTVLTVPSGETVAVEWMPDGRLSVLMKPSDGEPWGLYEVDPETGEYLLLSDDVTSDTYTLSWDPAGERVVVGVQAGQWYDLSILDIGTGTLTSLGVNGRLPEWSPSGEWIGYYGESTSSNKGDVWLIRPDGSEAHNLTSSPQDDESGPLSWAPSGQEVIVPIHVDPDFKPVRPTSQLYAVDISSGGRRALTNWSNQNHFSSAMSPSGDQVVYYASDYWGNGSLSYGLYLSPGPSGGTDSRWALAEGESIFDLSWQADQGCVLDGGSSNRSTLVTGDNEVKVGSWVAQGCFTKNGSAFTTKDRMDLSGVSLDPGKGRIKIDTSSGRLTSTGPVQVFVEGRKDGKTIGPVPLHEGPLEWNLYEGSLEFKAQHFLNLPINDKIVVTAKGEGTSKINLSLGFPRIFGLGWVSWAIPLRNGTGLDPDLEYTADRTVSITDLIRLDNLRFHYNAVTKDWDVNASVAGGDSSADIRLKYTKGELITAHVGVPSLSLAGLIELKNVRYEFDRTKSDGKKREVYTFNAEAPVDIVESDTATGTAVYVDDALDSFSIKLGLAHVFSAVKVQGFALSWSAEDGWSGGGSAILGSESKTHRAAVEVELVSKKHRIVGGKLSAPAVMLGAPDSDLGFRIEGLSLGYSNTVLPNGNPEEVWEGGANLRLPGPDSPEVGGTFRFVNRSFVSGSLKAGNVYLGPGVKLQEISGAVSLQPLSIRGGASVRIGPHLPVLGVSAVNGQFLYSAPLQAGDPDTYHFGGDLTVGDATLLGADVTYLTNGQTTVSGKVDWRLGDLGLVEGRLSGLFENHKPGKPFMITGNSTVRIGSASVSGRGQLNKVGVAGCLSLPGTPVTFGFGYRWAGQANKFEGSCDMNAFLTPPGGARRVRAGAATTVVVPDDLEALTFELSGSGGPPIVTLLGPDGSEVSVPASGSDGFQGDAFVFTDEETAVTYIAVPTPAGGNWEIEVDGTIPLSGVRTAQPLPEPEIEAEVTGAGTDLELSYSMRHVDGQQVHFVERWEGGESLIGVADGEVGSIAFHPAVGPDGEREVFAVVVRDGLVRDEIAVTTFLTETVEPTCTSTAPCASSTSIATRRVKHGVSVSGSVEPLLPGRSVHVVLSRSRGGAWRAIASRSVTLSAEGTFASTFRTKYRGRCRVQATFLGDYTYRVSAAEKLVRC